MNGLITVLSPSLHLLTGWTQQELIGKPVTNIYANPEDRQILLNEIAKNGRVRDYEVLLLKRDGTRVPTSISANQIFNPDGTPAGIAGEIRDITERKRAEDALREREQRYHAVVEGQTEFICRFLPDGTHAFVNGAYCRYFGLDQKKMIGSRFRPEIPPDDAASLRQFFASLTPENPVGVIEHRIIMPDGSMRWQQWSDRAIFDPDGRTVKEYQSVGRDITDRKEAETALEMSERHKNAIIAAMPDTLVIFSRDGVYLDYHSNDENVRTLHTGTIIGTSIRDTCINPDVVGQILQKISLAIDTGNLQQVEYDITLHSGCHHIEARLGRVDKERVLGVIRDLTEYRKLIGTSKENESRIKQIFETMEDLYFQTDNEGIIRMVSPSIVRFTGRNAEDLIGTPIRNLYENPAGIEYMYSILSENGFIHDYDVMLKKMDGTSRSTSLSAFVIKDETGMPIGVSGLVRDITRRKQAEEALQQANQKLNLLTSITRHDINNQLTALNGYLALLANKQPDTTHSEYFQKVKIAAQRIADMIQFTREYENIGVSTPQWQDPRTLVDTAAAQAPPGRILVKNDLPAETEVFADPLIAKVIYNLIDNAMRYGGKITTIRFSVEEYDGHFIIVCEDDGDGIPEAEKMKIFERGFGKNTGLGLPLSREILLITGLTITETGEPGRGARFEMAVPKGAWRIAGVQ